MPNPQKTRRNPSIIASSKYAPAQPYVDERRERLDALGRDPAETERAKREIAQMSRQHSGRVSATIPLDDIEVQQRKPRSMIAAPVVLPPLASVSHADQPSQPITKADEANATIDQRSPVIKEPAIRQPSVSKQTKAQTSGGAQPARNMFEHVEHQPARSAAPTRSMPVTQAAQYSRDERYSAHAPLHDVYQPWETLRQEPRGQFLVLLVVALVSVAVIWMFFQSPKTFISTYGGAGFGNTVGDVVSDLLFDQEAESRVASAIVPAGEHSVVGEPSIDAAAIDTILSKYGSPAAGTGRSWVHLGRQYGIDPAYAVAFFIHESSAGTNPGWAGMKPDGSTTHNVGNIICAGYSTCFNRFRDYASWDEGIADWYKLISHEYVNGRGAASVEQIIPIYAPSFENDVDGYVQTVVMLVEGWRQGAIR
jgi:hypothetical protein